MFFLFLFELVAHFLDINHFVVHQEILSDFEALYLVFTNEASIGTNDLTGSTVDALIICW